MDKAEDLDKVLADYDSSPETWAHIERVQQLVSQFVFDLVASAAEHDASKLESPEKEMFDEWTPKLRQLTYGSEAYKAALSALGPALEHHYDKNPHHPEYHSNGVAGMTLMDVAEMLADWKAASERHEDGDMIESLKHNKERFGLDDQLYSILENTVFLLNWSD